MFIFFQQPPHTVPGTSVLVLFTCVPSFKHHLPSTSSTLSHVCFRLSCLCLFAWIAAVIPFSPSVIRGLRRNSCIPGSSPTWEHFTVQALICHHWQPGKKDAEENLHYFIYWETTNILIFISPQPSTVLILTGIRGWEHLTDLTELIVVCFMVFCLIAKVQV